MLEITKIIQNKHAHLVIAQMLHSDVSHDLPPSGCAPASSDIRKRRIARCPQRNFSKSYICSTVNVGYPRLMAQHPAHAQPARLEDNAVPLWLGDLRLALFLVVCVLVVFLVVICQASCDHQRPCSSFLTNSFVSQGPSLRA